MNELTIFQSERFGEIRTVVINNEPWFVATDVCRALDIGNPSQALTRLDEDERMTTLISNEGAATGKSQMAFVNEPGLYSLVLGSRKPEAKAFKRWITHEVIPAIRRTGSYSVAASPAEQLLAQAQILVEQEKRMEAVEDKIQNLEAKLTTRPEVSGYSIAGYASLRGIHIDVNRACILGRLAAMLSRQYGYEIGKVRDARFGMVNTYHTDILKEVFREANRKTLGICSC